ncbi:MAG TPA: Lrp/AsnC family transcriptional regulator [Nitrososphaerales archaeon]|nr:Lrp/AsnC family transcriptional regulator [Nitrososphaerales archaeon]
MPKTSREYASFVGLTGVDDLDLKILEMLVGDGDLEQKDLADKIGVDVRTVAKHIQEMKKKGVLKMTAEINWPALGVGAYAFVGTQTGLGREAAEELFEYIRNEPRVIEAYSTLGSDEYFFTVLDVNLQMLREEVLRELEPLTADLSTAIVSTRIKARSYAKFLAFLRERPKQTGTEVVTKTTESESRQGTAGSKSNARH